MLQGLNPVIIFKIWNKDLRWVEGATLDTKKIGEKITLKEWQDMSELDKLTYYTPKIIPIYLSEDIFKIACDDAEQNISVSTTTIDKLIDYVFNTPQDPGRSVLCVQQRCDLIKKNLNYLNR